MKRGLYSETMDVTSLFLTDLLHQASDLKVLLPLFSSSWSCTATFYRNIFRSLSVCYKVL